MKLIKRAAALLTALTLSVCSMQTVSAAVTFGDVNGDGKLTIRDVSHIAVSISKGRNKSLSGEADFNKDGKKDIRDAAFMANYISKKPTFKEMLRQINKVRSNVGASPLTLDDKMCAAAMLRAQETAGLFSHTRPDNTECFTVFKQFGISYGYAGENIAAGSKDVSGTMQQWINSQGHYENMINKRFTRLGVGMSSSPTSYYKYYWTQLFSS